ncbi:hypothetical protein ACWCPM_12510 [Streptomyces sp. NPDC002309]
MYATTPVLTPANLTPAQLDGIACLVCADEEGAMVPVGVVDGCQVFAHPACVDGMDDGTPGVALVVGAADTPADRKALRALAHAVASELGRPAVWATDTVHRVTGYSALYLTGGVASMLDAPALVLVGEALAAGVDVHEPLRVDEVAECPCGLLLRHTRPYVDERGEVFCAECLEESACTWCGEYNDTEDLMIVESGNAWIPLHAGCLDGIRRDVLPVLHPSADVLPVS